MNFSSSKAFQAETKVENIYRGTYPDLEMKAFHERRIICKNLQAHELCQKGFLLSYLSVSFHIEKAAPAKHSLHPFAQLLLFKEKGIN